MIRQGFVLICSHLDEDNYDTPSTYIKIWLALFHTNFTPRFSSFFSTQMVAFFLAQVRRSFGS
jgi:hypothetical protein